jgi:LL-diaminopimelate aminotransferase
MLNTSNRLEGISEYYFSRKLAEIDRLNKSGKKIINLGIGSPDLPPHPDVIKELSSNAELPNVHGYQSYRGSIVLRNAFSQWYKEWYNVELNPDSEILPLMGSKEGIVHICMTYLNPGDQVLVPNPGYPTYSSAVKLAGGEPVYYGLSEKGNWMPDFASLEASDLSRIKMMWVNYPEMPTGQLPDIKLFEKTVSFAKAHNILICHDNPYSFILNDKPLSLLSVDGAKEVSIELNSLSKSHNMAGWRIGMLASNSSIVNDVIKFKSNMDSGMFLPLQLAAAKALSLPVEWYKSVNKVYRSRKKVMVQLLDELKCSYNPNQAGMFLWARLPQYEETNADSLSFCDKILYEANVFITPGEIFGSAGNKYIRVSLCSPEEKIEEALFRIKRMRKSGHKPPVEQTEHSIKYKVIRL